MSSEGVSKDLAIYPGLDIQNFTLWSDLHFLSSPEIDAGRALPLEQFGQTCI